MLKNLLIIQLFYLFLNFLLIYYLNLLFFHHLIYENKHNQYIILLYYGQISKYQHNSHNVTPKLFDILLIKKFVVLIYGHDR